MSTTMVWDVNPILLEKGPFMLRWYGLCFAAGFSLALPIWYYMFAKAGKENKEAERLQLYITCGVIIGARLGHIIFYDWPPRDLIAIFSPVVFFPQFKIIGFSGLASHGAAIGIVLAVFFYVKRITIASWVPPRIRFINRRPSYEFLWILDHLVILFALGGACIRIGNFINSEVIGKPTGKNYGVIFVREPHDELSTRHAGMIQNITLHKDPTAPLTKTHYQPIHLNISFQENIQDAQAIKNFLEGTLKNSLVRLSHAEKPMIYEDYRTPLSYKLIQPQSNACYQAVVDILGIPRHPTQLYEALSYFLVFLISLAWWYKKGQTTKPGGMLGTFIIMLSLFRFFYEFYKECQVFFEETMWLNMGQLLSLPWLLLGLFLVLRPVKTYNTHVSKKES